MNGLLNGKNLELVSEVGQLYQRWQCEIENSRDTDIVIDANSLADQVSLANNVDIVGFANAVSDKKDFDLFAACAVVEAEENYGQDAELEDFVSAAQDIDNLWDKQTEKASQTDLADIVYQEDDDSGFPIEFLAA